MFAATKIIKDCFSGSNEKYRSDIDGLRALACLAVVLYHAFPDSLKGGFTGVDIFFVISGFLISSILYRNLFVKTQGKIDIVDFYIRRVRRIFPALIAVLIFVLVIGYLVLLPNEYERVGKHVLGGSTYISNFMLYFESGDYFNVESNQKPLLHLWSLGVEEQFYLIFPIFLWGLYKLKLNFLVSLIIFCLISFVVNVYFVKTGNGSYSFYMPWTRFWELSFGSVLAYICMFKQNAVAKFQTPKVANVLSILGVALIIYGYLTINSSPKFPGSRALTPVIGAIFVIAAGQNTFINKKILSSKLFIFFGLISYPLYLWHWPLLSFAYTCSGMLPDGSIRVICVVASIILATLTFYFIEPPLRYGVAPKLKALSLFLVLLAIGILGFVFTQKFSSTTYAYKNNVAFMGTVKSLDLPKYERNCQEVLPNWTITNRNDNHCYFEKNSDLNDIAIIGDSHSFALFISLVDSFNGAHSVIALPASWQAPLLGISMHDPNAWRQDLYKTIEDGYDYILNSPNIKLVIMAHYPNGNEYDVQNDKLSSFDAVYQGAIRTFKKLQDSGKKVIVYIDHPSLPYKPQMYRGELLKAIFEVKYSFDKKYFTEDSGRNNYYNAVKKAALNFDNVSFVETYDKFCDDKKCYSTSNRSNDGKSLYEDDNHLNNIGAKLVVKDLQKAISKAFNQ